MRKDAPDPMDAVRAAGQALTVIEQEAGIATAAERARDVFIGFPDSDLPLGSAASVEECRLERKLESEFVDRGIRALYFSVHDINRQIDNRVPPGRPVRLSGTGQLTAWGSSSRTARARRSIAKDHA